MLNYKYSFSTKLKKYAFIVIQQLSFFFVEQCIPWLHCLPMNVLNTRLIKLILFQYLLYTNIHLPLSHK